MTVHWRPHSTAIIIHPLFPQGSAHFLHPCEHLRASRDVRVPGLPFTLTVPQRQNLGGDDTGCAVWRGTVVLASRVLKHEAARDSPVSTRVEKRPHATTRVEGRRRASRGVLIPRRDRRS